MTLKTNISNKEKITFNADLTRLLVCPVSGGPLYYDKNDNCLISKVARIKFPIRAGIPILTVSESKAILND